MNLFKCEWCGRFLPKTGFISYTEYSGFSEFEPRDSIHICLSCYKNTDQELLDKISWIKPHVVTY